MLEGIPVAPGIAIGPVYAYARESEGVEQRWLGEEEVADEVERFRQAVQRAERELVKIGSLAREKIGQDSAAIFEAQALMLRDDALYGAVIERIVGEHVNADYAVHSVLTKHRQLLTTSENDYFRERANDLLDLEERVIRHLRRGKILSAVDAESIISSPSLTAADVVLFARRGILGIVMQYGGSTSHVAIMARALGLPAIFGIKDLSDVVSHGDTMILDGVLGRVIVRPEPETLRFYRERQRKYERLRREQRKLTPLPSETLDGYTVTLRANLEFEEELTLLKQYGAEGVGLFRTEILVLMRRRISITEDEQYKIYRGIVEGVGAAGTTFRVLDLGGDKMLPLAHREANPFLGWRGIRVLLDKPDLLIPQLRAILRASAHGKVRLLLPMVTEVDEVLRFRTHLREACDRLREEGAYFDDEIEVGIMVEVPAVALLAERFAPHVDFFSIGSNDLTQYTLAVDRGNDLVAKRYQELHPAVLQLINRTIEVGHRHGLKVCLCGELAGDPLATPILLGLGLDEFSLSPVYLPEVKRVIRSIRLEDARRLATACLEAPNAEVVRCLAESWLEDRECDLAVFLSTT